MTPDERIATSLEQIALELAEMNSGRQSAPKPETVVSVAPGASQTYAAPQQAAPAQAFPPIGWTCPQHHTMKVVPAGVSSRTNKPYESFIACGERGCDEKPPRFPLAQPGRAVPPRDLP